ncbi:MAG: MBOAT family protein [Pseudomonadales bacterium]|nr:MBOAT family protein [Pseudomonadales bacterium]
MNFASIQYLTFFCCVFFTYWHLSRKYQNILLLLASWFFYACWDWRFLSLILVSTLIDFVVGKQIHGSNIRSIRRAWLGLSVLVNLSILFYFKYADFFVGSFIELCNTLGFYPSQPTLDIILPVGISFYTFQSLSYSFDIYKKELKPSHSLLDFATFVAFFPQLVAGPIVRAKEFVHQLSTDRQFNGDDFQRGLKRFLLGLFKKAFIADTLAIYLVDPVFAAPEQYSSATLWLAMFGYAVQIYADFSGYTNMAIGSALMLGFSLPENFNFPYLATNISDFWRRWHMTMSRFFRDYVYIALGGNQKGEARTYVNQLTTTMVSGLWHGAAWTFVAWGGIHGILTSSLQFKNRHFKFKMPKIWVVTLAAWAFTQLLVCLAWVLFRANDFDHARVYLQRLFSNESGDSIVMTVLILCAFLSFGVDHLYGWLKERGVLHRYEIPSLVKGGAYALIIIFMFHSIPKEATPFIYFQF